MSVSIINQKCPLPVLGHGAVAMGDTVVVWGGYTTAVSLLEESVLLPMEPYVETKTLWVYNAEYDNWRSVTTEGDIPMGSSGAGLVVIGHYLYVFGGYTSMGNTNDLYRLDLNTMTWLLLDHRERQRPSPRDKFMSWAHDEKLYIFGGFGIDISSYLCDNGTYITDDSIQSPRGWNNQLFVYDTKLNQWTNPKCTGNVPSPRAAGATTCIQHKVYLFGGRHSDTRLNDLYYLDLNNLEWTRLYSPGVCPSGRSWHTITAISLHRIVLYGGYSQTQNTMNDVWLLDVNSLEWTLYTGHTKLAPRLWHTTTMTDNKDLVIFGGCSNDILSMEVLAKSHNEAFVLRFTPHSLLRLCLDAAHKYRLSLQQEFESLPTVLQKRLEIRLKTHDMDTKEDEVEREVGNATTCSLS